MSPDLKYLLFSVILTFVQMLVAAMGANQAVGLNTLAGNREGLPEIKGWAGRAKRAHLNMVENMVLFAALVLIAAVAGKANAMTAMGAAIFFWGRVAYAVIYVAGIAWLRTLAWFVSVIGMVLIAVELLKAM
ncbi:MAPEG family protein [uncultured Reyranella sp.]|uniref:MAPEG family protein n=1 Tax=uncultured Reyranella sp. TaxID=735512 RepID=UPI0025F96785|nr:MAPEG family protein [uncultured Reyranella sp.]